MTRKLTDRPTPSGPAADNSTPPVDGTRPGDSPNAITGHRPGDTDGPGTPGPRGITAQRAPAGRMLWAWLRQELTLLLREPVAVFFSLAFPLVIYVFIGIPYASEMLPNGARFIDVMFPALVGTVAANLLLMGLPIYLSELRMRSVIRRYRVLPLPGWLFASATLLSMLTLVVAACAVITGIIAAQHGLLPAAGNWRFIALALGLIAWLSALGFLLGTLPVGSRTIQALSAVVFFVMFFGSGAAAPVDGLPQLLQDILEWNPLKQWFDVMTGVYAGLELTSTQWLRLWAVLPLTVGSVLLGLRFWKRA
ncbi:ABC transporter permease [Arthrobacter sp. 260]|uniref:ABC transporter permease n=1 Tax=Arthrobacter sp. 260 TaxID=2735314 RepID=UPI001C11D40F|nr:ABC transporter permease [Arthrobacter sp. 260]